MIADVAVLFLTGSASPPALIALDAGGRHFYRHFSDKRLPASPSCGCSTVWPVMVERQLIA